MLCALILYITGGTYSLKSDLQSPGIPLCSSTHTTWISYHRVEKSATALHSLGEALIVAWLLESMVTFHLETFSSPIILAAACIATTFARNTYFATKVEELLGTQKLLMKRNPLIKNDDKTHGMFDRSQVGFFFIETRGQCPMYCMNRGPCSALWRFRKISYRKVERGSSVCGYLI